MINYSSTKSYYLIKVLYKVNFKEHIRSKIKMQKIDRSIAKELLIMDKLVNVVQVSSVKTVGIYYPIHHEPDITKLLNLLTDKNFALPKVNYGNQEMNQEMVFCRYKLFDNLIISKFCVLEPTNPRGVIPDVVLVPGIAFDQGGFRLGYGYGFYDKYFASYGKNIIKIGVCFHEKLVVMLPSNEYDIKMDYIITDQVLLKIC
jgi:5-formyltetrahydrofolate cyclo-ligase